MTLHLLAINLYSCATGWETSPVFCLQKTRIFLVLYHYPIYNKCVYRRGNIGHSGICTSYPWALSQLSHQWAILAPYVFIFIIIKICITLAKSVKLKKTFIIRNHVVFVGFCSLFYSDVISMSHEIKYIFSDDIIGKYGRLKVIRNSLFAK